MELNFINVYAHITMVTHGREYWGLFDCTTIKVWYYLIGKKSRCKKKLV